jgi:hypothetical protein
MEGGIGCELRAPLGAPKPAGFPRAGSPRYEKTRPVTVLIWEALVEDFKLGLRSVLMGSEPHASIGRARSPRVSSHHCHPVARLPAILSLVSSPTRSMMKMSSRPSFYGRR